MSPTTDALPPTPTPSENGSVDDAGHAAGPDAARVRADRIQTIRKSKAARAKARLRLGAKLSTTAKLSPAAAKRQGELSELFETGKRILPEYTDRLDRLVQSALAIWDRRDIDSDKLDTPNRVALAGLVREMSGLKDALERWIHKLSAIHEEGRVTDTQRLELRLRLTQIELKYHTALDVFAELKKVQPAGKPS